MIEELKPVASVNPGALLCALESAKSTTDSQVRRLLTAMVRVRDADSKLGDAQAKAALGDTALLLHRIHSMLFGAKGATETPAEPLPVPPPPQPLAALNGEVAEALSEFAGLREAVHQASALVDQLLLEAEQALQRIDQRWNTAK
jgi:hypothetical protein